MAVDKMELLKRYKELKAQGVNITLMELKKQMGVNVLGAGEGCQISASAEGVNVPGTGDSCQVSTSSGVNVEGAGEGCQVTNQNFCHSELDSESSKISKESSYGTGSFLERGNQTDSLTHNTSGSNPSAPIYKTPQTQSSPAFVSSFNSNSSLEEPQTLQQQDYQSQFEASMSSFVPTPLPAQTPLMNTEPVKYSGNVSQAEPAEQNDTAQKFALIGYPLGHSLSAFIHNAGFKSLGMDSTYEILETAPDSLVDRIKYLKFNGYKGFNVTIPLKLPVTMFLDEVDVSADVIGAVNTVVINPDKTMKGYNTDVIGFRRAIPDDVTLPGKVAGVLGTGGAARAAITALAQSQVKEIKIFTRNVPNSIELLNFLRSKFPNVEFNAYQIERIRDLSDVSILVNATPIGMQGRAADLTPVEENELRTLPQGAVVYDVIYNPKKTVLLKLAQKNGYRTINGVDMFISQALVAEQIWTGRTPDFKDMKIAALENL